MTEKRCADEPRGPDQRDRGIGRGSKDRRGCHRSHRRAGSRNARGQAEGQGVREAAEAVVTGRAGVVEVVNDLNVEPPEGEAVPDANAMAYRESRPPIIPGPR